MKTDEDDDAVQDCLILVLLLFGAHGLLWVVLMITGGLWIGDGR